MTPDQIERAKAQGAQKRKERAAKRKVANKPEQAIVTLPSDMEERLQKMGAYLERLYDKKQPLDAACVEEIKALLTLESKAYRLEAYKAHQLGYENLIFYAWNRGFLGKLAFEFFDDVLAYPETSFTSNSLLRIIGCSVNYRLLKLMEHHRKKILAESQHLLTVYRRTVDRQIKEGALPWEDPLSARQVEILKKIQNLLEEK